MAHGRKSVAIFFGGHKSYLKSLFVVVLVLDLVHLVLLVVAVAGCF